MAEKPKPGSNDDWKRPVQKGGPDNSRSSEGKSKNPPPPRDKPNRGRGSR